ncbi:sensor histidine kinase [Aminipila sp.]|uniref:sensor histidine kinase n=1 Tax=Aminipila sp. TaxID=2060095 RepID=UPI002897D494|nr:ATP-binding protein [Aminipila sp.]
MKKRFLMASVGITACNVVLLLFVMAYFVSIESNTHDSAFSFMLNNKYFGITMVICVLCSGIFSLFMYNQIMKPVHKLQEQMVKTTEENKKAEQIRSEFVANVTHELKTPLTSISGFIETLQDGAAENPEIRNKFIDIIAIETSRLERLIEDVLVLSDIENKRAPLDIAKIDTKDSLIKMISTMEPLANSKNIKIETKLANQCFIEGNVDRFIQMMMNLIENAIKYSKEDQKGKILVSSFMDNDKVYIEVTDNGIGISEEHFDRLFERFYRVDKSRTKKGGGTGLGLSIVKHIAFLFNAEVSVKSTLGEGTTFTVIFNRKED